jgi:hypothetical protein
VDPIDLTDIVAIAVASQTSFAQASDGSLWSWGGNPYGTAGVSNTIPDFNTPQRVMPPTGYVFTSISAEADGNFAVATVAAVPEPSVLGLAVVSAIGLRRRKR